jgi:hypothetical protein
VDLLRTTRCCSALALSLITVVALDAGQLPSAPTISSPARSDKAAEAPLSPFPSRTHWTLALNSVLTAPPAFQASAGYFSIEGDRIAAYELNHGTLRWVASVRTQSRPVVGGDLLFVEQAGTLVALRTLDGSTAWQQPLLSKLTSPLAWRDNLLIAGAEMAVLAFSVTDGQLVWRHELASVVEAEPALSNDRVYVPTKDGRVIALRLRDGTVAWERRLGGAAHDPLVAGDRVLVGSSDNYLYSLDARDGEREWRWQTGADVVARPLADEHRVYFVSLDNVLRALNLRNGVQQWKRGLAFRPAWGPIRAADTLVLTGIEGTPRAFYLKDGAPAGEMRTDSGAEIAAPPHAFESAGALGPALVIVSRRLESGATVTVVSRSIEPTVFPTLLPLPGLEPAVAPVAR